MTVMHFVNVWEGYAMFVPVFDLAAVIEILESQSHPAQTLVAENQNRAAYPQKNSEDELPSPLGF